MTFRRARADERGTIMLEMALVTPVLLLILFTIISYGILLSYKQSMTQVAADAARTGAVAGVVEAETIAQDTLDGSTPGSLDRDCGDDGLVCTVASGPCVGTSGECLTVEVRYDNDDHPMVPPLPFISDLLPGELVSRSVVRISGS